MQSSGNTILLAAGDYRAQIVSVGAGLAELTWQGKHLVIPHNPEEMPLAHLGKVLIPWPNRIANGCYQYEGRTTSYRSMSTVLRPPFTACSPGAIGRLRR